MGCYQSIIGISPKPLEGKRARNELVEREEGDKYRKMVLGLSLILSVFRKKSWQRRRKKGEGINGEETDCGLENKSWLLAEADGGRGESEEDELQSVHSSFRLSFGSQAEAEEGEVRHARVAAGATVLLLVNLEDDEGLEGDGPLRESQKWRRLESLERSISPVAEMLVRFSYEQIRVATCNFSRGRELGRGALSRVYRGRIGVGRRGVVAIKKVEGQDRESAKAFCRELMIASSLQHPNIVPLLGFCVDQEGLFLVYKYVSGGSLDHHLHTQTHEKRRKVLPWEVRYKVAMGVAQAIGYLHYDTDKCVVHRDIKPSNILLSSNKTAKLCDFGLATWTHGPSLPFLCKSVKGTFGYLAPEYFQHGKLSDKTDVYAFGVVLLELFTGRKAIDQSRSPGDENLVLWAKPYLQQGERSMEKLIDPRLKPGSYRWGEMSRVVRAAAACLRGEESTRPSIYQVIEMLQAEEEFSCSTDWSVFTGNNSCLLPGAYGSHLHGQPPEKCDIMRGHLALAMLGVSDSEEEESHNH